MDERELRDLKAKIVELQERYHPVSEERLAKLWASVRESLDDFTQRLVEQELARRGHNDTLAKLLNQQRQNEAVMQAQAVTVNQLQEQVNTLAVQVNSLLSGAK